MDVVRSIAPVDSSEGAFVPACALKTCNHVLDELEILSIIDRGYAEKLNETEDFLPFLCGKTKEQLKTMTRNLVFKRVNLLAGHMKCPSCTTPDGSDFWFAPSDDVQSNSQDQNRIVCPNPRCNIDFCSNCNSSPYHFHCKCNEVVQYTRAWNDWSETGRVAYVAEMNAKDKDFAKKKADFDRAQKDHAAEIAASKKAYDVLVQDEQYKATKCKMCPHCSKIVEQIDGCDAMICGRDAHGGNTQNGCGARFNWKEARSYQPNIGQARTLEELKAAPPQKALMVHHEIYPGQPKPCDICHVPIVGPMIKCLNCPCTIYCLKCNSTNRKHWKSGPSHVGIVCFEKTFI
jgi:hypothetical protein